MSYIHTGNTLLLIPGLVTLERGVGESTTVTAIYKSGPTVTANYPNVASARTGIAEIRTASGGMLALGEDWAGLIEEICCVRLSETGFVITLRDRRIINVPMGPIPDQESVWTGAITVLAV